MYTMTASIQASRGPQYTGSHRMATLSQSKLSHYPRDSRQQQSPWSTAVRIILWQGVRSANLNEKCKTQAHPLKQTYTAIWQTESRPLTLSVMHSTLEEPLAEEVPRFERERYSVTDGFKCCEVQLTLF